MEPQQQTAETLTPATSHSKPCPCCSGQLFEACCLPILDGRLAPTAEALVRSRYTAFAERRLDHVEDTHAPEIRADFNRAEAERLAEECQWRSLRIHTADETGDEAQVEFVMEIRRQGATFVKAGKSRFRREDGRWLFVSTKNSPHLEHAHAAKINRNDPCVCGSGRKYKKCCGAADGSR